MSERDPKKVNVKIPKGTVIDVGGLDFVLIRAIKIEGYFAEVENEQSYIANRILADQE